MSKTASPSRNKFKVNYIVYNEKNEELGGVPTVRRSSQIKNKDKEEEKEDVSLFTGDKDDDANSNNDDEGLYSFIAAASQSQQTQKATFFKMVKLTNDLLANYMYDMNDNDFTDAYTTLEKAHDAAFGTKFEWKKWIKLPEKRVDPTAPIKALIKKYSSRPRTSTPPQQPRQQTPPHNRYLSYNSSRPRTSTTPQKPRQQTPPHNSYLGYNSSKSGSDRKDRTKDKELKKNKNYYNSRRVRKWRKVNINQQNDKNNDHAKSQISKKEDQKTHTGQIVMWCNFDMSGIIKDKISGRRYVFYWYSLDDTYFIGSSCNCRGGELRLVNRENIELKFEISKSRAVNIKSAIFGTELRGEWVKCAQCLRNEESDEYVWEDGNMYLKQD